MIPSWLAPANRGPGVFPGHLLVLAVAVLGVVLLGLAWFRLWRAVRRDPLLGFRHVWWVMAAWTAPLLFAAPFASQDAWVYAAQGKVVASGLPASSPLHVLGHSVWLSGVDPRYLRGGSIYGPGAVDLSAGFARISGGHPWIAVEFWRLAVIGAMLLCCWGVAQCAAHFGANPVEAVVAGVANPGILLLFVAGVHNDAVMIGIATAAVALALTRRPWWALGVAALAVTIKAPAALAVLAIAWCVWKKDWQRRAMALGVGLLLILAELMVLGLGAGGGFTWLNQASVGTSASSYSFVRLAGITSSGPVNTVQLAGVVAAAVLVLGLSRSRNWIGVLAAAFAVAAVFAANPQPWYLLWALPLLGCTLVDGQARRPAIMVLCVMTAWSVLPFGVLVWLVGLVVLAVLWFRSNPDAAESPASEVLALRNAV